MLHPIFKKKNAFSKSTFSNSPKQGWVSLLVLYRLMSLSECYTRTISDGSVAKFDISRREKTPKRGTKKNQVKKNKRERESERERKKEVLVLQPDECH